MTVVCDQPRKLAARGGHTPSAVRVRAIARKLSPLVCSPWIRGRTRLSVWTWRLRLLTSDRRRFSIFHIGIPFLEHLLINKCSILEGLSTGVAELSKPQPQTAHQRLRLGRRGTFNQRFQGPHGGPLQGWSGSRSTANRLQTGCLQPHFMRVWRRQKQRVFSATESRTYSGQG